MPLKQKIVALSLVPLLLAVVLIGLLVADQHRQLGQQQAELIEQTILASKRAELKNYVAMALSLLAPLQNSPQPQKAQQEAFKLLETLNFGSDGYFFIYDQQGRNLMHPRQAELVGKDLWDMKDPHGLPAVQALLKSAHQGDGFQRYVWKKPSTQKVTDKLAYVVMVEPWGWMLGTGIYLEDIEQATRQVHQEVSAGIRTTMHAIAVIALVAVLLVSVAGLALNVREQRLADSKLQVLNRRLLNLQEEERSRVSRELHDGISQLLASIKFQFELANHQLEAKQEAGMETLAKATLQLGEAIGEVRRISHDLHPSLLDTLGLAAAIGQLSREFEQRCAMSLDYCNELGSQKLPNTTSVALFRIVQEALTNIERHAKASHVQIALSLTHNSVQLKITDDGIGLSPQSLNQNQDGIGLRNIRDRVEHLGGNLELLSNPGCTQMRVLLPLTAQ